MFLSLIKLESILKIHLGVKHENKNGIEKVA